MPFSTGSYRFPINKVDFDLTSALLTSTLNTCLSFSERQDHCSLPAGGAKTILQKMFTEKQQDISNWVLMVHIGIVFRRSDGRTPFFFFLNHQFICSFYNASPFPNLIHLANSTHLAGHKVDLFQHYLLNFTQFLLFPTS